MARFSAAWRTTGAGSTTLPAASLFAQATGGLWLLEVWATNTSVTATSVCLRRATAAGTAGAAQTVQYEENDVNVTTKGNPVDTHTVAPTLAAGAVHNVPAGASIGSGPVMTFAGSGLFIPSGTANGVCLLPLTGTGQILDVKFTWLA